MKTLLKRIFGQRGRFGVLALIISFAVIAIVFAYFYFATDQGVKGENQDNLVQNRISGLNISSITTLPVINPENYTQKSEEKKQAQDQKIDLGRSAQGNTVTGRVFGSGEDAILLFGAIHGNEKSSAKLLERLVGEISLGSIAVSSKKKVIIVPILNPDGYKAGLFKVNANDVNLNLNFDTAGWKPYGGEANLFAGTEPFSEIESRIIRDIVYKYNVKTMVSFHAKGGLVNPEFGHVLSQNLARQYSRISGHSYYEDSSWDYPGTATKWFIEKIGGPAITVELTDLYNSDWARNQKALADLLG